MKRFSLTRRSNLRKLKMKDHPKYKLKIKFQFYVRKKSMTNQKLKQKKPKELLRREPPRVSGKGNTTNRRPRNS